MGTELGVAVTLLGVAAIVAILVVLRIAVGLSRQSRALVEQTQQANAAHQQLAALLGRYLAQQEEKAAQEKQRQRDEALPRLAIASSPVFDGACTISVRNLGPTATRVRMSFRPALATGATPQFDACQTGTTQQFAAQFESGRPAQGDELRVSYVDAVGCNGTEVYGMEKTAEGAINFHLKRRERAMWS
jgi:Tfp pilus assembly protein PilE